MLQYPCLLLGSGLAAAGLVVIPQQKADYGVDLLSQVKLWPVSVVALIAATRETG